MPSLAKAIDIKNMDERAMEKLGFSESSLVGNAASSAYRRIISERASLGKTAIVCGAGNNGADGYALARMLMKSSSDIEIIEVFEPKSPESISLSEAIKKSGKRILSVERDTSEAKSCIIEANTIIDAIFGVGYDTEREFSHAFLMTVGWINESGAFTFSIDMPSGISSDDASFAESGNGYPIAVKADATITFCYSKPGLESAPGVFFSGRVFVENIGLPDEVSKPDSLFAYLSDESLINLIPRRRLDSNKGNFGKLVSFCGSKAMPGAAVLAANGAMAGGVGLLNCLCTDEVRRVLQTHLTEPIYTPLEETMKGEIDVSSAQRQLSDILPNASALLIGCGIGRSKSSKKLAEFMIEESNCPVLLDADGLNVTAESKNFYKKHGERIVITPHPGEMSRLVGMDIEKIEKHRIATAEFFADEFGSTVLLKGYRTVIASKSGLFINKTGNPGMAKAGMGDILAGLIASFMAQGIDPFYSAAIAAFVHGAAGDLAAREIGEISMRASDLIPRIAAVLKSRGI